MTAVGAVEVQLPVAPHAIRGEPEPGAVLAVGRGVQRAVADRVDQRLEAQRRVALVAQPARRDGREVAAGRVAGDAEPRRVGAELARVPGQPADGGAHVVGRRGKRVLRREPVADARDRRAGRVGQRAAQRVERVERADRPAAAVRVGHQRQRPVRARGGRAAAEPARPGPGPRARAPRPPPAPARSSPPSRGRAWRAPARSGQPPGGLRAGLHQVDDRLDLGVEHPAQARTRGARARARPTGRGCRGGGPRAPRA